MTLNSGMERKQTKYASIFSLYFLIVVHENETKSHKQITMKVLPTIYMYEKQDNSFPATMTKAPNILTKNTQ